MVCGMKTDKKGASILLKLIHLNYWYGGSCSSWVCHFQRGWMKLMHDSWIDHTGTNINLYKSWLWVRVDFEEKFMLTFTYALPSLEVWVACNPMWKSLKEDGLAHIYMKEGRNRIFSHASFTASTLRKCGGIYIMLSYT